MDNFIIIMAVILSLVSLGLMLFYRYHTKKELSILADVLNDLIEESEKGINKADNELDREVSRAYKYAFTEVRKTLIKKL